MRLESGETLSGNGTLDMRNMIVRRASQSVERDALVQRALVEYPIPLTGLRVHNAVGTPLAGMAVATDDVQTMTFQAEADGGTFRLKYKNVAIAAQAYNVAAADLQVALRAIHADLAACVVTTVGGVGVDYVITTPAKACTDISIASDMILDGAVLEPAIILHTTQGVAVEDDLGLVSGTFGTDAPTVQTSNAMGTTIQQYARAPEVALPAAYAAGQDVVIRVRAGMLTTVAGTSATVDLVVRKHDTNGAVGSDICATPAQSINSLTKADFDFTVTATGLNPGDVLDVRVVIDAVDATANDVYGEISRLALACDIIG